MSQIPEILQNKSVINEDQDVSLTTVKLTPNSHSNVTTRFQIPKQGHILDSNSCLVWSVSWDGYVSGDSADQAVFLKDYSGGLNTIRRARFIVGGREIFTNDDVGQTVHIKNLKKSADMKTDVVDMQLGSQSGYFFENTTSGKVQMQFDGSAPADGIYIRKLGSWSSTAADDRSIECSLKLSDIFSGLKSVQLPMSLDDIRVELDWETDFKEVAYVGKCVTTAITDFDISIKEPRLLLDFLTLGEDSKSGLDQVLSDGYVHPFVHTSVMRHQLSALTNGVEATQDILINLQGKLIMKMYVGKKFNDDTSGVQPWTYSAGRCRAQCLEKEKYNLFINDQSLYDLEVDKMTERYQYLGMALESDPTVKPGTYEYRLSSTAAADVDIVANAAYQSGDTYNDAAYLYEGGTIPSGSEQLLNIIDAHTNMQGYIGFDLSKYESETVIPQNAGYRVGSSAVILRFTETGTAKAAEVATRNVDIFVEEVKMLQVRNGMVDVMDV